MTLAPQEVQCGTKIAPEVFAEYWYQEPMKVKARQRDMNGSAVCSYRGSLRDYRGECFFDGPHFDIILC